MVPSIRRSGRWMSFAIAAAVALHGGASSATAEGKSESRGTSQACPTKHAVTANGSLTKANRGPVRNASIDIPDHEVVGDGVQFRFTLPKDAFTDQDIADGTYPDSLCYKATGLPSWMSFDPTSRMFSGVPRTRHIDRDNPVEITVTAIDSANARASDTFSVTVIGNRTPVAPTFPEIVDVREGKTFTFRIPDAAEQGLRHPDAPIVAGTRVVSLNPTAYFSDPDGDELTYRIHAKPDWVIFNPDEGKIVGNPTAGDIAEVVQNGEGNRLVEVAIIASDGKSFAEWSLLLRLAGETAGTGTEGRNPNSAPLVANPVSDHVFTETGKDSLEIPASTFEDPDGDALSISMPSLPPWLSFDELTAMLTVDWSVYYAFSGTARNGSPGADGSRSTVVVIAEDPSMKQVAYVFSVGMLVTNSGPGKGAGIEPQVATATVPFRFPIPAGAFEDEDGDPGGVALAYTANERVHWLRFDGEAFYGTPGVADVGNGVSRISITATDSLGRSETMYFDLTVGPAPQSGATRKHVLGHASEGFDNHVEVGVDNRAGGKFVHDSRLEDATLEMRVPRRNSAGKMEWATRGLFRPLPNGQRETRSVYGTATVGLDANGEAFWKYVLRENDPVVSLIPGGSQVQETLQFRVEDRFLSSRNSDWLSITVYIGKPVVQPNRPPVVLNPVPDVVAIRGVGLFINVPRYTFLDPDGDWLTYTVTGLPSWLRKASSSPLETRLEGNVPAGPSGSDEEVFTIAVTATDEHGASVSHEISVTIAAIPPNEPPIVVNPIHDQIVNRDLGLPYFHYIPLETFRDPNADHPNGDQLTYTATGMPDWMEFYGGRYFRGRLPSGALADRTSRIVVTATDTQGATASTEFSVTLNYSPVAADDELGIPRDSTTGASINVLANDRDAEGDAMTVKGLYHVNPDTPGAKSSSARPLWFDFTLGLATPWLTQPDTEIEGAYGTLTMTAEGVATYVLKPDWIGYSDSSLGHDIFVYCIVDSFGARAAGRLRFEVTGATRENPTIGKTANRAPIIANPIPDQAVLRGNLDLLNLGFGGADSDESYVVFSDPDGDALTYSVAGLPSWARHHESYHPTTFDKIFGKLPLEYDGPRVATVVVTATDTAGASVSDEFSITANHRPVAKGETLRVSNDATAAASIQVLANDADADSDTLSVVGYIGDSTGGWGWNDLLEYTYRGGAGSQLTRAGTKLEGNYGTLEISSKGRATYLVRPGRPSGRDMFHYAIEDGFGGRDFALLDVYVERDAAGFLNRFPNAIDDEIALNSGSGQANVLANDFDQDGDALSVTRFWHVENPEWKRSAGSSMFLAGGSVTIEVDGHATYTPVAGSSFGIHAARFGYEIIDGKGAADTAIVEFRDTSQLLIMPLPYFHFEDLTNWDLPQAGKRWTFAIDPPDDGRAYRFDRLPSWLAPEELRGSIKLAVSGVVPPDSGQTGFDFDLVATGSGGSETRQSIEMFVVPSISERPGADRSVSFQTDNAANGPHASGSLHVAHSRFQDIGVYVEREAEGEMSTIEMDGDWLGYVASLNSPGKENFGNESRMGSAFNSFYSVEIPRYLGAGNGDPARSCEECYRIVQGKYGTLKYFATGEWEYTLDHESRHTRSLRNRDAAREAFVIAARWKWTDAERESYGIWGADRYYISNPVTIWVEIEGSGSSTTGDDPESEDSANAAVRSASGEAMMAGAWSRMDAIREGNGGRGTEAGLAPLVRHLASGAETSIAWNADEAYAHRAGIVTGTDRAGFERLIPEGDIDGAGSPWSVWSAEGNASPGIAVTGGSPLAGTEGFSLAVERAASGNASFGIMLSRSDDEQLLPSAGEDGIEMREWTLSPYWRQTRGDTQIWGTTGLGFGEFVHGGDALEADTYHAGVGVESILARFGPIETGGRFEGVSAMTEIERAGRTRASGFRGELELGAPVEFATASARPYIAVGRHWESIESDRVGAKAGAGISLEVDGNLDLEFFANRRSGNDMAHTLEASFDRLGDGLGAFAKFRHAGGATASDENGAGRLSAELGHATSVNLDTTRTRGARATFDGAAGERMEIFVERQSGRNAQSLSFGRPIDGAIETGLSVSHRF